METIAIRRDALTERAAMRKLRGIFAATLCVSLAYLISNAWAHLRAAPHLEISPEFHVGELVHGEELDLTMSFRNGGTSKLKVEPPIPGCRCAAGQLSREIFAPGEAGSFRVKLRPARPPGTDYTQEIIVPSNDPQSPLTVIYVKGRMAGSLVSFPASLDGVWLSTGQPWKQELTIGCTDATARFKISSITSNLGIQFGTPVVAREGFGLNGSVWTIPMTRPPTTSPATEIGEIVVRTTHPRYSELRLRSVFEVKSQIRIRPVSLLLDESRPGDAKSAIIDSNASFSILNKGKDGLSVELVKTADSKSSVLTVRLSPERTLTSTVEKTAVHLSVAGVPGEAMLVVPVTIIPGAGPHSAAKE